MSAYDPCALVLPDSSQPAQSEDGHRPLSLGFLIVEVDDIIEAGTDARRIKMDQMAKVEDLSVNASSYAGRKIRQMGDFSFQVHMEEYVYTRLAPVSLARKVLVKDAPTTKLQEFEKTQFRGVIQSLACVARESRPDAAAAASILAATFPEPSVSDVLSANEMVRHLKQTPIRLKVHAMAEKDVRHVLIADSAFDASGKEKSQHGWLQGFSDPSLNAGGMAPMTLIQWRSKRLRRKASSSMLYEALSLSAATASFEKQVAMWDSLRFSNFSPREHQRNENKILELQGKATVIASESGKFVDPDGVVIIDAKALFDNLVSGQPGDCERSNLEIAVIRESLTATGSRPRWIPHNVNPADALTKLQGCHAQPLMLLLKTGKMRIEDEGEVFEAGKQSQHRQKTTFLDHTSETNLYSGAVESESHS